VIIGKGKSVLREITVSRTKGRPERPLPVWEREEVQERVRRVALTLWQRERERAALAVFALEANLPSQQLRQSLAQVQA
jgi:hypothetical protein